MSLSSIFQGLQVLYSGELDKIQLSNGPFAIFQITPRDKIQTFKQWLT